MARTLRKRRRTPKIRNGAPALWAAAFLLASCGEEESILPENREDGDGREPRSELAVAEKQAVIEWGSTYRIRATLTSEDDPVEGETVRLDGSADSARTDARGRVAFRVEPDLNSTYKLSAQGGGQAVVRLEVVPAESLEGIVQESGAVRYEFTLEHPDSVSLEGLEVLHYLGTPKDAKAGSLPFKASTPLEKIEPGISRTTFKIPASARPFEYQTCIAYPAGLRMGGSERPEDVCDPKAFEVG